jgi:uroporphyrinogen decarboxylase
MPMTSRERVLTALSHYEPDRVPIDFGGTQTSILVEPYNALKNALGISTPTQTANLVLGLARIEEPVLERFGVDFRHILPKTPSGWKFELLPDDSFFDEWGVVWHRPEGGYYYDMVRFPLGESSWESFEKYRWPDPGDPGRIEGAAKEAAYLHDHTQFAVEAGLVGLWESSWFLVGLERWLVAIYEKPDFVEAVMDKVLDILARMHAVYLDAVGPYVDLVTLWDDYGAQLNTLISPTLWRKLVKPRLAQLVEVLKRKTNASIGLHSCGSLFPILDDLVEVGIQVLNPIQVSARGMAPRELKKRYGQDLVFWGGIDTHFTLPCGTEEDVRNAVYDTLDALAPGGGYILAAVHNIQPGVPARNIIAMYDAGRQAGRYPIANYDWMD